MDTRVIPLRDLQSDPERYLRDCCDTGQSLLVELPDRRLVAIQPVEENDELVNELIESNPAFRALLAKSAASHRKPFQPALEPDSAKAE